MKKSPVLASLLLAVAIPSACVVAPMPVAHPYYGNPVMVAPPPPRVEYVGPPPAPGQIWIGGYWNWTGHRHEWVPGRWEVSRQGYNWAPHRWERDGDHWRQSGGHWEKRPEHEHHEYRN